MAFRTRTRFLASGYDVGGPGDEFAYVPSVVIGQARTSLMSSGYVMEVPDDPAEDEKFFSERGDKLSPEESTDPNAIIPGVVPLPYETHSNVEATPEADDERTEGERILDPSSAADGGFTIDSTASEGAEKNDVAASNADCNATDGAKKLANEEGVDLKQVEGSGDGGRVQQSDVEQYISDCE